MNKLLCDGCGEEITNFKKHIEVHITKNRSNRYGYDYMKDYHEECFPKELRK